MNPQQTPAPNPYDYILNPQSAPQKSPFSANSPKSKIILSVIFVLVVITVVVIAFAVFKSLTKKDYSGYEDLLKKQATIIHVTDTGLSKAKTAAVRNYLSTIRAVTKTEEDATITLLNSSGKPLKDRDVLALADTSNDKKLTAAEQTNNYDETLTTVLNGLIVEYQKAIKDQAAKATAKKEKALMATLQTNALVIANSKSK